MIIGVGDEQIANRIHGHAGRQVKLRGDCGAAIATGSSVEKPEVQTEAVGATTLEALSATDKDSGNIAPK
jgi:hypothetical protein